MVRVSCTITTPWLLMGDFNSILNSQERVGGSQVRPSHFVDFHDCIEVVGLFDMRFTGSYLTWINRQEHRISSKLDRVLVNAEWCTKFPDFEAEFVNLGITSDHSHMIIRSIAQPHSKRRTFRSSIFGGMRRGFMRWLRKLGGNQWWGTPYVCTYAKA